MIVNRVQRDAENLKELIEFMDEPTVCTATPDDWRLTMGERRLGAVFLGADLSEGEIQSLLDGIGVIDPNMPIVMLHEAART